MFVNECKRHVTAEDVAKCQSRMGVLWNGRCPYQNGSPVTQAQVDAGYAKVACAGCTAGGCTMEIGRYVQWNGLCVHQPPQPPLRHRDRGSMIAREEAALIMQDPATSFWLRGALRALLTRDPIDALSDAQVLAEIMRKYVNEIQGCSR